MQQSSKCAGGGLVETWGVYSIENYSNHVWIGVNNGSGNGTGS